MLNNRGHKMQQVFLSKEPKPDLGHYLLNFCYIFLYLFSILKWFQKSISFYYNRDFQHSLQTFMKQRVKYSIPQPKETVDICIHRKVHNISNNYTLINSYYGTGNVLLYIFTHSVFKITLSFRYCSCSILSFCNRFSVDINDIKSLHKVQFDNSRHIYIYTHEIIVTIRIVNIPQAPRSFLMILCNSSLFLTSSPPPSSGNSQYRLIYIF